MCHDVLKRCTCCRCVTTFVKLTILWHLLVSLCLSLLNGSLAWYHNTMYKTFDVNYGNCEAKERHSFLLFFAFFLSWKISVICGYRIGDSDWIMHKLEGCRSHYVIGLRADWNGWMVDDQLKILIYFTVHFWYHIFHLHIFIVTVMCN